MDASQAPSIDVAVKNVAAYGRELSAVFHQYGLIAERVPRGFEGATNVLDATVATLNQVLSLFKDEAGSSKNDINNGLFSLEGTLYIQLLVMECAKTLTKVVPIINDACLPRKELLAKAKRDKKQLAKHGTPEVSTSELRLDSKAFLESVENTRWSLAVVRIEDCMERLYDLQLHLLLVFQVVTVGALSRDLSSGKVDIKSIITYHDRILRTADLLGIKAPKAVKAFPKKKRYDSSSSVNSFSSDSDSDSVSDDSSTDSVKPKGTMTKGGLSPPVPSPPRSCARGLPPPPPAPLRMTEPKRQSPLLERNSDTSVKSPESAPDAKPPSYSESHRPADHSASATANPSTPLGTISQGPDSIGLDKKTQSTQNAIYPNEKETAKEEGGKKTEINEHIVHMPHLFKSKSHTFRFKLKSIFSNKESLAAEMRQALCTADSHLLAFVIQRHDIRQVPHSAFHSLEATHMKTILSQLNDNTWYQNFTTLEQSEHSALHRIMYPWVDGKVHEREVVVLKSLKNDRKAKAWLALTKALPNKHLPPPLPSHPVLAIVREKSIDGNPLIPPHRINMPAPPPLLAPPVMPAVRPPPLPCENGKTQIQDLRGPPNPPSWPSLRARSGPPSPPSVGSPTFPSGNGPPGQRPNANRAPLTEYDAAASLITYNEYTVRPTSPVGSDLPRPWARVAVAQESAERHLVQERVQKFQRSGGNVVETKLRLTDDQSAQVTRLMDWLKSDERDARFEWCWVEISLHNAGGEITDFIPKGQGNISVSATLMHLVAKRSPKPHYKPLDLYNSLVRGTYGGRGGDPIPAVPGGPRLPSPPRRQPSPPAFIPIPRKPRPGDSSDSGSDSLSSTSYSSSDSSVGKVRRRLRSSKIRRNARSARRGTISIDSDSDSDSDSEAEDVIKISIELKKGDDVVEKLLSLWTPTDEGKGKGKAAE